MIDLPAHDLIHGAVRLDDHHGACVPRRLSTGQSAALASVPNWATFGACASGISLRVITDAPWVELDADLIRRGPRSLEMDAEVDGALAAAWREVVEPGRLERRIILAPEGVPAASRRLCLHLPVESALGIRRIAIPDGCTWSPEPPSGRRLLVLGDSITQGAHATGAGGTWPAQLARLLGMDLFNQALCGHAWHPSFLAEVPELDPALVICAYGVNDWRSPDAGGAAGIGQTCAAGLAALRPRIARARLVVMTPLWCDRQPEVARFGSTLAEVRAAIAAAARDHGAEVVDGAGVLPHQPWWLSDGVHPRDAGMTLIAAALARALAAGASVP